MKDRTIIFLKFIKLKWYLCVLIILICATYGSIRGAAKENEKVIWVTAKDYEIREARISGAQIDAPIYTGYLGLASEQNKFYNLELALKCSILGIPVMIICMLCYYFIYNTFLWKKIRNFCMQKDSENRIFM